MNRLLKAEIVIDTDAFIYFKSRNMLEMVFDRFNVIFTEKLFDEMEHHIKTIELEQMKGKFLFVELNEEEKELKYKIIKWHYGKNKAIDYKKGKFKRSEGEIDGICLGYSRKVIYITLDHHAQLTAKNFHVQCYNPESFIYKFLKP